MHFIFLMGKIYFFYNIRLFMYSNDLKTKAINLYYKLNSYRKVQELLDIGKSTVQRWVFCDKKNIRKCFDKTEIILFIKSLLDNDCFISCKMIGETIYRKYKKILSKSLIYTIITKSIKYSYKKINKKIYSKNIQDLVCAQNIFSKNIEKINKNNIICVDETYIYSNYSSNRFRLELAGNTVHEDIEENKGNTEYTTMDGGYLNLTATSQSINDVTTSNTVTGASFFNGSPVTTSRIDAYNRYLGHMFAGHRNGIYPFVAIFTNNLIGYCHGNDTCSHASVTPFRWNTNYSGDVDIKALVNHNGSTVYSGVVPYNQRYCSYEPEKLLFSGLKTYPVCYV